MKAKNINDQEKCEGCRQRHDCREVYGKLGGADGPSVTLSVIIAFLSPIVVFVVSLAAFERVLGGATALGGQGLYEVDGEYIWSV